MPVFGSEIQELIYGILTGDASSQRTWEGDEIDRRISLSLSDSETCGE